MVQLEELTAIRAPIERCFDLARSVEVHWQVTYISESKPWRARELLLVWLTSPSVLLGVQAFRCPADPHKPDHGHAVTGLFSRCDGAGRISIYEA